MNPQDLERIIKLLTGAVQPHNTREQTIVDERRFIFPISIPNPSAGLPAGRLKLEWRVSLQTLFIFFEMKWRRYAIDKMKSEIEPILSIDWTTGEVVAYLPNLYYRHIHLESPIEEKHREAAAQTGTKRIATFLNLFADALSRVNGYPDADANEGGLQARFSARLEKVLKDRNPEEPEQQWCLVYNGIGDEIIIYPDMGWTHEHTLLNHFRNQPATSMASSVQSGRNSHTPPPVY